MSNFQCHFQSPFRSHFGVITGANGEEEVEQLPVVLGGCGILTGGMVGEGFLAPFARTVLVGIIPSRWPTMYQYSPFPPF